LSERFRENFYANRIRRSDDDVVSVVFPASSTNDLQSVQSILPELPQEQGIAYVFPDNLNVRENRQTSFIIPETTTPAATLAHNDSSETTPTPAATLPHNDSSETTTTSAATLPLGDLTERLEKENEILVNDEANLQANKTEETSAIDERSANLGTEEHLEHLTENPLPEKVDLPSTEKIENIDDEEEDKSSGEEEEIISVSVSRSMSEAFSIPEVVTGIIEFFTTTFAPPPTEQQANEETLAATDQIKTGSSTTATTTTTTFTATENPLTNTDKSRTNVFAGKRVHPFLASKIASQSSTTEASSSTTTTTSARKSFFRQKTLADLNNNKNNNNNNSNNDESSKKIKAEASETATGEPETGKSDKKFNILNRDSRPRFNILNKKTTAENETVTTTIATPEEVIVATEEIAKQDETKTPTEENVVAKEEEVVTPVESVDNPEENKVDVEPKEDPEVNEPKSTPSPILGNQKLRPKFQVPKSLQGRLLEQAVVEKSEKPDVEKEEKSTTEAPVVKDSTPNLRSPLRQRQQSRFSAPATSTSAPVVIKSIAPRSRNRIRPDKPLDLSASPSQTVTRTRPSSPKLRPSSESATEEPTSTTAPRQEGPTTTEKLTVADVLATLHGEPEAEPKTSTLRPHSFKPKFGSASRDKLREKLREHLTPEDHEAALAAGVIFDDENDHDFTLPAPKEHHAEDKPVAAPKPAAEITPARGGGQVRRVARPRPNALNNQPIKNHHNEEEELPRSNTQTIITAPRRRQRPQSGAKVRPEGNTDAAPTTAPPSPTGGRLLSDADLMTGLGFGKKDEEKVFEFMPTPSAPLSNDEEEHSGFEDEIKLEVEEELEEEDNAEAPVEKQEEELLAGPFTPSIEDILKSAVVEHDVPIAKEVILETSTPIPPPVPETPIPLPAPEVSVVVQNPPLRSRSQLPVRHRLENVGPAPAQPGRQQSNLIESKRVRSRQRVIAVSTQAPEIQNAETAQDESATTEHRPTENREISVPRQRQVTRVRQPIRTHATRVAPVQIADAPVSGGTRSRTNNNSRPVTRVVGTNNNKLRVRGGSRSTTEATPTPTTTTHDVIDVEEEKVIDVILSDESDAASEDKSQTENEEFVPDYDLGNVIGKLELTDGESTNIDENDDEAEEAILNHVSNDLVEEELKEIEEEKKGKEIEQQQETIESEIKEKPKETEVAEEGPLRTFQPRFGEKQRNSVRSKLRNHLFEQTSSSPDSLTELKDSISIGNDENTDFLTEDNVTEETFKSVSPSEGLGAVPATFFTTTSRFELASASSLASFLPTQRPQTRIGRSTVGYRSTANEATEKPGLFSKLGISEHSVRDDISITTTPFSTDILTTILSDDILTTTVQSVVDNATLVETELTTEEDPLVNKSVEVGNRLFKRKKVDLLSKLSGKLSDREEKEKKLLNSFAESHSRITTKIPVDEKLITLSTSNPEDSSTKSPLFSSFLRPRRKFEIGAKDFKPILNLSTTEIAEVENSTDTESPTESTTSTTTLVDFNATTIDSSNITTPPTTTTVAADIASLLPTPRPLPKLPFGKKGGGAFKPILFSFSVEKKKKTNVTSQESGEILGINNNNNNNNISSTVSQVETTTVSIDEVEVPVQEPVQQEENVSKVSSLKQKFQFGRKAFGKLAGSKGPEVAPPSSPPPSSSTTTTTTPSSNSSSFDPNTPPTPDVLLALAETSAKVF